MADFQFEANFDDQPPAMNDDPAAEFLAREKETLAGLEDEFEAIQMAETVAEVPPPSSQENGTSLFDTEPVGLEDFIPYENPQLNGEATTTTSSSSVFRSTVVKEEPEKIKKWREEQKQLLEQKDAEEAVKKEELRVAAKKELDDWYARYKEQIEKSKLNNRATEKEWIVERDTEAPGQEWERIAKLCDFNPKSSRNTKDTSRMRSIILQLKQSPLPTKA